MILTTHALVGAALGKNISNPIILIILSLIIHYSMDIFRHGEYLGKKSTLRDTWWKVAIDLLVGISIILFYITYNNPGAEITRNILLGTFTSMFPDFLTVLYWKLDFKFLKKAYNFHQLVHSRFKEGSRERAWTLQNAVNDILFSTIAIILLIINF